MIFHISGCDCTVKTTLCNKLNKKLQCGVTHFDKPKDMLDGKNQYFNFLKNLKINENIICDRFHDGEYIYAPLYRNYEADYLEEFETELRKYPYLFINTFSTIDKILERANERGEDFVNFEDFNKVLSLFEKFIIKQNMPYIRLNTTESNVDNDVIDKSVDKILKYSEIIVNLFNKNVNNDIYFGNLNAKYVIYANDFNELIQKKNKILKDNCINIFDCWFTTVKDGLNEKSDFLNLQRNYIYGVI